MGAGIWTPAASGRNYNTGFVLEPKAKDESWSTIAARPTFLHETAPTCQSGAWAADYESLSEPGEENVLQGIVIKHQEAALR